MTKPQNKMPIESFGAELFNALIEGSKRTISLQTTYRNAIVLRLRVHRLRHRMQEENHPLYPIAAKTKISISWPPNTEVITTSKHIKYPKSSSAPVTLTFAPHNSEFANLLKAAGVNITPIDHQSFDETIPNTQNTERPPTLEDLLKDFK